MRATQFFGCLVGIIASGNGVRASDSYHLLLESDADRGGGAELFKASYDSLEDFLANRIALQAFSSIDISTSFSAGGFAFDGSQYHLLLESDADRGGGAELFMASYDSLEDFLANRIAFQAFSSIDINGSFSAGGFTFDGSQYHLLLESDADRGGGAELFMASYDSLEDFLANRIAFQAFSAIDISTSFSAGGFAFDGSQYHLLLESNENRGGGNELFMASYDSLEDFLANRIAFQAFSAIDISASFSAGGFTFDLRTCAGDLDRNGIVDFPDLLSVLAAWGDRGGPEDLDRDGIVGFGDLLIVLAGWGACP